MMRLLFESPRLTAAISFFGYLQRHNFAAAYNELLGLSLTPETVGLVFVGIAVFFTFLSISQDGWTVYDVPSFGDTSPHGVKSWDEHKNPNSTIYCPVCGYNADVTVDQHANLCAECQYDDGRSDGWSIPDVAADAAEYGELREEYVRGEMRLDEFRDEVEVEVDEVDTLRSYD